MSSVALCQALAERCATDLGPRLSAQDRQALHPVVRTAFVDTAACILAGTSDPATATVVQWVRAPGQAADGRCSLLWGDGRAAPGAAALVNAVSAHALDYDDVGLAGHPGAVLVPVLLAEHEHSGVHGFALTQAYAKGYTVWRELQQRLGVSLHARGWHPTAVFGTLAAAAAVAAARQLGPREFSNALGIAASLASGVVANFGSMTKPLQVGRAAQAGFQATELALLGLDASPDALDGPAGLLSALVGREHVVARLQLAEDFDAGLLRERPGIKKYPVCYAVHRVVDGVLDLVQAHALRLQDIAGATATISTTTAGVLRHHRPESVTEARFSVEFAVAAALLHGRLGLREVTEETLQNPALRAFLPGVKVRTVDTRCTVDPSFAYHDEVVLEHVDGRLLHSGPIRFARGHAQLPLQEADILAKLRGCAPEGNDAVVDDVLRRIDGALAD